jgi:hypothetical protein
MLYAFAAAFVFAILTLWVPAYWPVAVFQFWVFGLASVAVIRGLRPGIVNSVPFFVLSVASIWGVVQIAAGWAGVTYETKVAALRWLSVLATFVVASQELSKTRSRDWFRLFMVIFGTAVAIQASFQTFTNRGKVFWLFDSDPSHMMMGPIIYHNHFAAFIEAVLPLALYEGFHSKKGAVLYFAASAIMFGSVIVSASRSGVIICAVELIVVMALVWKRDRQELQIRQGLIQAAAIVGLVVVVMGWQSAAQRFQMNDPFTVRREFALSTVNMIKERPLTGFGLGNWPAAYPGYAVIDLGLLANRAHSDWLEWAAEGGVFYFAAFLVLAAWCVRPALESIWGLGILGVFVEAVVDYPFSRPALAGWAITIVAMLVGRQIAKANARQRFASSAVQPAVQ